MRWIKPYPLFFLDNPHNMFLIDFFVYYAEGTDHVVKVDKVHRGCFMHHARMMASK